MTPIKFRAWIKSLEVMADVLVINFEEETVLLKGYKRDTIASFNQFALLQSAGIKDKNGVEIYEGDIVKELWESINGVESTFHMRVFKDNTEAWRVRYPNYTLGNVIAIRKRIEVIGSVYENPELLEVD